MSALDAAMAYFDAWNERDAGAVLAASQRQRQMIKEEQEDGDKVITVPATPNYSTLDSNKRRHESLV